MTTRTACALSLLIALYLATPPAVAQAHIWLEGENTASTNYDTSPAGWGTTEYLSEGLWLSINIPEGEIEQQVPDEGILLEYEFDAPGAGDYQVWGRVGFEFVRAPFDWRIDDGPWDTIDPREDLSTDLMEVDRWNEVAWVHMGDVRLDEGGHVLTTRLSRRYRGEGEGRTPERIIYTADAFCLYPGEFRPNGKHEPGSDYQDADDRRAAERVIDLEPLPPPGQRARTDLSGLWQIARYDETWVEDRTGPIAQTPAADELHWYGIEVPGNRNALRPEMKFCHRYFYRTRVRLPEALAGRRLLLDVDEINMLATVFVNGQRVAFHDAPVTGFVADITDAAKPGEINEVWVGIKDTYYA
ncbi:MAG: hypothetical protein GF320_04920, partial [Armatimonadia bacterium]|nr:hypothetical protein [Armatimonadia bacterium]